MSEPEAACARRPARARAAVVGGTLALAAAFSGCRESQRIGDHVLVEKKSNTRFRIHFDFEGYDWEDDVAADKVLERIEDPVSACALPPRVRATLGLAETPKSRDRSSPYRVGDRVRVRWRGSVYPASVTAIVAADTVVVHYQGHEDA